MPSPHPRPEVPTPGMPLPLDTPEETDSSPATGGYIFPTTTTTTSTTTPYVSTTMPESPSTGTVWINSDTSTMHVYNGTSWIETSSMIR